MGIVIHVIKLDPSGLGRAKTRRRLSVVTGFNPSYLIGGKGCHNSVRDDSERHNSDREDSDLRNSDGDNSDRDDSDRDNSNRDDSDRDNSDRDDSYRDNSDQGSEEVFHSLCT